MKIWTFRPASFRWSVAAGTYIAMYAAASLLLGHPAVRLWTGNLGLLISPLFPVAVCVRRRGDWSGRTLVFWSAVAAGSALWFIGHVAWMDAEVFGGRPLPWVEWPVAVKLCGGILPMIALLAWPHASIRGGSPLGVALDIGGLAMVSLFLFWSVILAPGLVPSAAPGAVAALAIVGTVLHGTLIASFACAAHSARRSPWRDVYVRCAIGAAAGALLLIPNAASMMTGSYVTGSIGDIGWVVPFWWYARAAADAPPSVDAPQTRDQWIAFTTKVGSRDLGLHLSVAFGVVQSHGGVLELVPTGRGACFRLTLPGAGASLTPQAPGIH